MIQRTGFIMLAIGLLTGCQGISNQELETLNTRANKANQFEQENVQLKQGRDALIKAVIYLKTELKQEVEKKQVLVEQDFQNGGIKITLQQQILFSSNSYEIDQEGAAGILKKVIASLDNSSGNLQLRIVGHSDNIPVSKKWRHKFSDNWDLSSRRAGEVARYLVWGLNFPRESITVSGRADVEPIASNDTEEGRAKNRRIELLINQ